jgi:hypothetical protein
MTKDETTHEESTDQPAQESTPDDPGQESQDQPNAEVEEDNQADPSSDEAQQDDSEEGQEAVLIDGEEYTEEELKELVSKGKHFTYNMQQLRERERQLEQGSKQPETPKELSDEEKEIAEAQKTLKRYGVVTEDQVDAKLRQLEADRARKATLARFRQEHPEITDFAARMIDGAARAWNISYEEAYKRGWGEGKSPKKVVRKKTLGARKSASTPVSNKGGGAITRADIRNMSPEEYKKNLPEIERLIREGELK